MEAQDFIQKWSNSALKERAAAQEHFIDLCRLLGEPTPAQADPTGADYGFEVGATKTTGGKGFADVFKRGFFAWEYKGTKANLDTAFAQLQRYAIALNNPPLLVVSDIGSLIRIHTNWTNSVSKVYEIPISDLGDVEKRAWLKAVFSDPEALRPKKTRQQLTEEVAGDFAKLARSLRERGHAPEPVAHFINRLVFCMFAEDVKLLPDGIFARMLERALEEPGEFEAFARDLFVAMKSGGRVGFERIAWFNGGLFDNDLVISLTKSEIKLVRDAAAQYWGDIDPSILGTLFERGLDPDKRSQLGAHYTDRDKIMMVINPVIVEPLTQEWETTKSAIAKLLERASTMKGASRTRSVNQAQSLLDAYLKRLGDFRVLDPACGSGNFLYLALRALKDLEHKAQVEAEALGLPRGFPRIGPEVVKGIEINPYAAELARVSVWIGEIQWMLKNGFAASQNPILKPLTNIECRDALLDDFGNETTWPDANAIVGNPPFLGAKLMYRRLGRSETDKIRRVFAGRLNGFTDLVCYWFEKAQALISEGAVERAGFVATKSISKNTNLPVMIRLCDSCEIFNARSNDPWVIDGAAVRVSLISFQSKSDLAVRKFLDGKQVEVINPDLTTGIDLTRSADLKENSGFCFVGIQKSGPLEIAGELARSWMLNGGNPNGRPNSEVLKPFWNGDDVVGRPRDIWLVDFPTDANEIDVSLYEAPYGHISSAPYDPPDDMRLLKDVRSAARDEHAREKWWNPYWPRPEMRRKIFAIERYLVTPMTAEHRVFYWLKAPILPDNNLVVVARADDTHFGLLSSRHHEVWSTGRGNRMGAGNQRRYNGTSIYESFPFPAGLTPNVEAANYADDPRAIRIAEAAKRLNELRENWLNPPDLVRREPDIEAGYPARIIPINGNAKIALKKRTLTNLYNERPAWLAFAHKALDEAVSAAYGWELDLADDEILFRLFSLNQERAQNA